MRKNSGRNLRRTSPVATFFSRRNPAVSEDEWFLLEADVSGASLGSSPRRGEGSGIIKLLGIACLCTTLSICAKWGYDSVFYKNEEFVLKRLDIQTDGALSESKLAEVSNISAGMNLMKLDLERIQTRIEKLPSVEQVTVTRELPDKVKILVEERFPIAWLSCPPLGIRPGDLVRGFLIDENGVLFRCLDLNEGMKALPTIEAYKIVEPVEGAQLETDGIASALRLIVENKEIFSEDVLDVEKVSLRNEWSIECLYRGGMEVVFSLYEVERGLADLVAILKQTRGLDAQLQTVNVASARNIPVTFSQAIDARAISSVSRGIDDQKALVRAEPEDPRDKHLRSILKGG